MNYWLMKSEPDAFSIDDLKAMPNKTEHWDGIRNYQARNMMRDDMKKGDLIFFYHSNAKTIGIVGIAKVVKKPTPISPHSIRKQNTLTPKVIPTTHAGSWWILNSCVN